MNKKGQIGFFLAFLVFWLVLSLIGIILDINDTNEVCTNNLGKLNIDNSGWGNKYYCIINGTKYEIVRVYGDGWTIVKASEGEE